MVHKQNHVIKKFILSISILFFTISCSNIDDDYAILNKVINDHLSLENNPIYLIEKGKYPKDCLKQYYIYKYDKKEYNKILKNWDSVRKIDSVNYNGKYFHYYYFHKKCINDSIFNKEEVQYLIKQKDSIIWNVDKIKNDRVIVLKLSDKRIKENKLYPISVSKPIYSRDKKLAIVNYSITKRLIFKKINGEWQLINKIDNHL